MENHCMSPDDCAEQVRARLRRIIRSLARAVVEDLKVAEIDAPNSKLVEPRAKHCKNPRDSESKRNSR
jgi:hypothetical protein